MGVEKIVPYDFSGIYEDCHPSADFESLDAAIATDQLKHHIENQKEFVQQVEVQLLEMDIVQIQNDQLVAVGAVQEQEETIKEIIESTETVRQDIVGLQKNLHNGVKSKMK
ncbi:MAG: hypothetical protein HWD61_06640 [Parachlamydiaceae bacterium]|nr:MAG: hypothetical protein HWD61_06640 [Parachlamydiaceae bacterium]